MTQKETNEKIAEYEAQGIFNIDINPVDWSNTLPVTEKYPYINKNIFRKMLYWFRHTFVIKPTMRAQNKKVLQTIVHGEENLEDFGNGIITCNHVLIFDCLAIKYALGKKKIKFVVAEYNNQKGVMGGYMRAQGILPLSDKYTVLKKFNHAIEHYLEKGESIVIYPEQNMWNLYDKPRPYKDGAFHYAAHHNVPVLPLFITYRPSGVYDDDGIEIPYFDLHIMPAIYPDENKTKKENIAYLRDTNYKMCVDKYEEVYGKKLKYNIKKGD